ncbi:MAG: ABC transporter ATP-binding protein [Cellulomonadaceae bacterium]
MPPVPAVDIRGLTKRYGDVAVVDGLDLAAPAGQITAVLGPNGAGKTTTIECCEGLRGPDAGSVRVLGLDPQDDAAQLRARVGVMLQDGGLPTGVRAMEMLQHVAHMYARPRDPAELSERLGLGSFARTTVRRLSGGQRQRLALAAALVGRPELVFLDEPSAGMDPQSRHAVWDLVRELRAEGVSIVLTTHLMDEAAELADLVVIVDHGRVIAQGSPAELVAASAAGVSGDELELAAAPFAERAAVDAAETDALASGLQNRLTERHGGCWQVRADAPGRWTVVGPVDPDAVATITRWSADEQLLVTNLDLGQRTLESVFLDLTGRSLR